MKLIQAELMRLFARRFVQLMLAGLMVAFVIMVISVLDKSRTPTEQSWLDARAAAEDTRERLQQEYTSCMQTRDDKSACEAYNPSRIDTQDYLWGVFNFAGESEELAYFLITFLTFFGVLVAASFVGAELTSGGMTNLLLWKPNRVKVLATKLMVALGGIAAVAVVYSVLYLGTFYIIALTTGYVGPIDRPGFWTELLGLLSRGLGFTLMASAIAFAIATIGRHTAAALGAFVGYIVVWELGARIIMETVNMGGSSSMRSLFLATYVENWFVGPIASTPACVDCFQTAFLESVLVFATLSAAVLALAFTTFRRRDLI